MAHFVWISPLQCILCVGLIWELIEFNSFCTLAAISLLGVIQACLCHKMGPYKYVFTELVCSIILYSTIFVVLHRFVLWICTFFSYYLIISLPPKTTFHLSLMLGGPFDELEQVAKILCSNQGLGLLCAFKKCKHSWEELVRASFQLCSIQATCFVYLQLHLYFQCEVFFQVQSLCPARWPKKKKKIDPLHPECILSSCLFKQEHKRYCLLISVLPWPRRLWRICTQWKPMAGRRSWRPSSGISDSKTKCDQNSISYTAKKKKKKMH